MYPTGLFCALNPVKYPAIVSWSLCCRNKSKYSVWSFVISMTVPVDAGHLP